MFISKKTVKDWLETIISSGKISEKDLQEKGNRIWVKELALYTSVGLIADLISGCERQVFERGKPIRDGTWYKWNVSANPNQTASKLVSEWVTRLYYKGHALIVPLAGNLYVASDYAIDEYPIRGDIFKGISVGTYQINRTFRVEKAYFIRQNNPEIQKLLNGIFEDYSDLLTLSKKAYKQSGGEKYALQIGKYPSGTPSESEAAMQAMQDRLSKFAEASNAVYPLTTGQQMTKLSSASGSASSSDYSSIRKEVYDIVASALHIPVGLLDGNITSVDQVLNQTLTLAIDPLAKAISEELTRKTYDEDEITRGGCKIVVDTTSIRHIDIVDMADKLDKLLASGIMCIDEIRSRCNMPELNTDWSEKHFITKNYESIDGGEDPLEGGKS